MLDTNEIIQSKLSEIGLNVYLENFLDSDSDIPCLSYQEYNNSSYKEGDQLGYSKLIYYVKVWAKDYKEINTYACAVDSKMRSLGFRRTNKDIDVWLNGICQRGLKYENLASENFNGGN